ncbi:anti-sigma factor [Mangrovicoccus algicola]|uniref:Regulator of SigK n=1 Tax=Mangrovicoccus algicola TaxID=2771008 RepID=A0A8J6YTJ5_9RHOB|nr:anti-sigma factor [Mangrovicoccus algicola]MBE3637562.1 anti-sigma factor [Mangrovicoccus algicola]
MTGPGDPPTDEDVALAGEYVLGALALEDRQAAALRIARDPGFALEVARWEARLDPLAEEVRPVTPPARLRRRIEARVFGAPRQARPWSWLVGAGGLAAASLAATLWLGQPQPPAPGQGGEGLWISDMVSPDGTVRLAALYDADSGEMRVSVGGAAPATGRDFELWLIQGEAAPISLGVMPHQGQAAMPIPEDLRPLVAEATLAITDEPEGGSPGGVATGPVVAAAPLRRI